MLAHVLRRTVRGALLLSLPFVPSAGVAFALPTASVLYVAPAGVDTGTCTKARPCASFDRAYALAGPGARVKVRAGRYGAQTIRFRPNRDPQRVIFEPAGAGPVTVTGEFTVRATNLDFRRLRLYDLEIQRDAANVVFRQVHNRGFWIQGATSISFIGGEVTCGRCAFHPFLIDGGAPDFRPPRKILFDGVYFHDWHTADPSQHTECLQILAGDGIVIRRSVFKNCATADGGRGSTGNIHVSWIGRGSKTRNVLIENNFFYKPGNLYAVNAGDWDNLDFRYNSVASPIFISTGWGDGVPVEVVGNVMKFSGCSAPKTGPDKASTVIYRHNVLDGGTCGPTDKNAPAGFIDPARNLRLKANAPAINAGDPASHPRRDIDGERRPKGGRPDAGADERR